MKTLKVRNDYMKDLILNDNFYKDEKKQRLTTQENEIITKLKNFTLDTN